MTPSVLISVLRSHRVAVVALIVGIVIGVVVEPLLFTHAADDAESDTFVKWRMPGLNGALTNPVLECREGASVASRKVNFKNELDDYVQEIKRVEKLSRVGVSFRDLNNGPAFGVDRDSPFITASLLKVPVMMALYKHAETDPSILKKRTTITETVDQELIYLIPPEKRVVEGTMYTVEELIEYMIKYSDNNALLALTKFLPQEEMAAIYELMGLDYAALNQSQGSMSVQEYSSFFRILFNSSYLSRDLSEKALQLLGEVSFDRALRAGVPDKKIKVAHKFGERTLEKGTQHFHDCGIVYYPKHPYLLCVMTQGRDIDAQIRAVASISSFVYEQIDEQHKK